MTKIDIISGFLGAGKTTFINKLIKEAYKGEKLVLIENEFGEIGIDGGFLKDAGIEISEMNSGCICCSLVGDFSEALIKVKAEFEPDRILIEPSGVGKLSDVIKAVQNSGLEDTVLNSSTVVVDACKCKMYMKNFGEFFNDQISCADCIVFSHTDKITEAKLAEALALVRGKNEGATIVATQYDKLDAAEIIKNIENKSTLAEFIDNAVHEDECPVCGHHHHDHDHEECCHEHHHHDHDHEECCHEHHHHDHDHEECFHGHHHHDHDHEECFHGHHHHDHDHEECCHEHHHHAHHYHHADEVFTSWGRETVRKYTADDIKNILSALEDSDKYGLILRAKGMVESPDGSWVYFDYVPEEPNVRSGSPSTIGKLCVIGAKIDETAIAELFGV